MFTNTCTHIRVGKVFIYIRPFCKSYFFFIAHFFVGVKKKHFVSDKQTMASPIYKVFVAVGLICILHAAYSAAQHRTYLRLTKTEFLALPLDIAIQVREKEDG